MIVFVICAWGCCVIIFRQLHHIDPEKAKLLFPLLLCSPWCMQIIGYIMLRKSHSFVWTLHYLIIICRLVWKHLTYKLFVSYIPSSEYLIISPFSQSFLWDIGDCVFSTYSFLFRWFWEYLCPILLISSNVIFATRKHTKARIGYLISIKKKLVPSIGELVLWICRTNWPENPTHGRW